MNILGTVKYFLQAYTQYMFKHVSTYTFTTITIYKISLKIIKVH